jgi:hypothetical protein
MIGGGEAEGDAVTEPDTRPSTVDAQLVLQQAAVDATTGALNGRLLLQAFDAPPTLAQLRKRHPPGSVEYAQVNAFLMSCETTATFVRQGLLNEALVHDLYWFAGYWRAAEKVVKGLRREHNSPGIYENTEWLARRGETA